MTNDRKCKNFIGFLKNDRGEMVRGASEVDEEIFSFFMNLYDLIVSLKPFVEGISLPMAFLQDKWDFVKDELDKVFKGFFKRG